MKIDKPLIIIGMHRSGTSFVAELLHEAGIHMGKVRDPNFEAMHFLSLNQQLLNRYQADWLSPKPIPPNEKLEYTPMELFCEHFKIQSRKFFLVKLLKFNTSWGWKDPRNTFTLPLWLSIWPQAQVLHVYRNGWEVAQSLKLRNQIPNEVYDFRLNDLEFNFHLWELYVQQAFTYPNVLHIDYEKLLQKDTKTLREIENFTGKNLNDLIQKKVKVPKAKITENTHYPDYVLQSRWMQKLYL